MLDALGFDSVEETMTDISDSGKLLMISEAAVAGTKAANTFRLVGQIQKQQVLMLIDSGSSHCFVSESMATKLQGEARAVQHVKVKLADGYILTCDKEFIGCEWWCQWATFHTDLKVLPLGGYDVIIGINWFYSHNPMGIDWIGKRLAFCEDGKMVLLKGLQPKNLVCKEVAPGELLLMLQNASATDFVQIQCMEEVSADQGIPMEIEKVLDGFGDVFTEPTELPPTRPFDHAIPLEPGAKPVNLRPYRYSPKQKDEIEKQVKLMIKQGIIKPSVSPFALPVLLVLKKDKTWRFYVDYRHLNSITIKNWFPLPIIEELIDELAGAQWFTSLDLRAGYHQIRMKPEDECKTSFKTHHGHYEFRVMSFGLTGAPATFQNTMNTVLAPVLRKGVLVFIDDILIYSETLEEHARLLKQVLELLQ